MVQLVVISPGSMTGSSAMPAEPPTSNDVQPRRPRQRVATFREEPCLLKKSIAILQSPSDRHWESVKRPKLDLSGPSGLSIDGAKQVPEGFFNTLAPTSEPSLARLDLSL